MLVGGAALVRRGPRCLQERNRASRGWWSGPCNSGAMRHSVPDKDDVTPTRRARGSSKSDDSRRIGELEESVQLLEKLIGELRLEVGTCRVLLRLVGVTQQEFDLAREQLKKDWNPAADIANRVVQQRRRDGLPKRCVNCSQAADAQPRATRRRRGDEQLREDSPDVANVASDGSRYHRPALGCRGHRRAARSKGSSFKRRDQC